MYNISKFWVLSNSEKNLEVKDMSESENISYSLLTQDEIDALVDFLTEKKTDVGSTVMSQDSIDKLIEIIRGDLLRKNIELMDPIRNIVSDLLQKLEIRSSESEICELRIESDSSTNFLIMNVYNTATGVTTKLTPDMVNDDGIQEWGFSISPIMLTRLALTLHLKFTDETYSKICRIYAKYNLGSEDAKIPSIFLPVTEHLTKTLI